MPHIYIKSYYETSAYGSQLNFKNPSGTLWGFELRMVLINTAFPDGVNTLAGRGDPSGSSVFFVFSFRGGLLSLAGYEDVFSLPFFFVVVVVFSPSILTLLFVHFFLWGLPTLLGSENAALFPFLYLVVLSPM